ncbi:unnamed protein product [Moneuplotes crassus]|uniref:C2H2-type domain-containing protein n=1 Tax=Euplotes crassus TaxID=5936 RepID=A0AAD1UF45_EUPCR|nr:unnamed protein product [Moneuplotes crassus]
MVYSSNPMMLPDSMLMVNLMLHITPLAPIPFSSARTENVQTKEHNGALRLHPAFEELLKICGFCPCDLSSKFEIPPLNEIVRGFIKEERNGLEREQESDITHSDSSKKHTTSSDRAISDPGHREGDEKLLHLHPHEIIYCLNPKTGRKVKKITCKIDGCGKTFEKKWNFKDHIRVHLGQKPYQCKICQRGFIQKGNLTKHMKKHNEGGLHSRKIHKCEFCSKRFTEKYNMKSHKKKCKLARS